MPWRTLLVCCLIGLAMWLLLISGAFAACKAW
jgi:hypothetical protein